MPFQAWIRRFQKSIMSPVGKLQWGHALSGMDTSRVGRRVLGVPGLQWGHALSGMDTNADVESAHQRSWLQWGHALSGMDTEGKRAIILDAAGLQWGHALSGMDTRRPCWPSNRRKSLQWGHALSGMDTFHACGQHYADVHCFNGAMPFQAWIRRHQRAIFSMNYRFNGAMPFQAWIHGYAMLARRFL